MDHLIEKTLKVKEIYKGRVIDMYVEEVELPDGSRSDREVVKHPGAVAIIPITRDGKLVLVRQFRQALSKVIVEIPAGKLESGEEPYDSALRELEEETGYKTEKLDFVVSFYTSPGFADEMIHLYVTDQLEKGTSALDDDEFLDVMEVSLEEAEQLIQDQLIHDAKTIYAVQYLKMRK